jgi:hypothetical protein
MERSLKASANSVALQRFACYIWLAIRMHARRPHPARRQSCGLPSPSPFLTPCKHLWLPCRCCCVLVMWRLRRVSIVVCCTVAQGLLIFSNEKSENREANFLPIKYLNVVLTERVILRIPSKRIQRAQDWARMLRCTVPICYWGQSPCSSDL